MRCMVILLAMASLTPGALAQHLAKGQRPGAATLRRELDLRSRTLLEKGVEANRILDNLVRHHLGLPPDVRSRFALTEAEREQPREEVEAALATGQEALSRSSLQLDLARDRLEKQRRIIMERPAATAPSEPWLLDPVAVDEGPPPRPSASGRANPIQPDPSHPTGVTPVEPVGPPPTLVHGSTDASQIGRALFHAAQYGLAKEQLESIAAKDNPPLLDLFYLARSYEKLGDLARADGMLIQIEEADTKTEIDGTRIPGRWAVAARLARQHMKWMGDYGDWQPSLPGRRQDEKK